MNERPEILCLQCHKMTPYDTSGRTVCEHCGYLLQVRLVAYVINGVELRLDGKEDEETEGDGSDG